jgi:hypothetical protein
MTGTCPVPLWRDAQGQGASRLDRDREAPACLSRPKGGPGELHLNLDEEYLWLAW